MSQERNAYLLIFVKKNFKITFPKRTFRHPSPSSARKGVVTYKINSKILKLVKKRESGLRKFERYFHVNILTFSLIMTSPEKVLSESKHRFRRNFLLLYKETFLSCACQTFELFIHSFISFH